ncbi:hypothetical protein B9Z19DRAFT_1074366 [Tuber borchii]|uniref:Uncharacterized protein n=1 Tax=Tuber borchii TaxID=42251 RepID=A0A2T7A4S4_TUBBO|nr:hypothetical protein B9Z19DRAFT_1074366 [Tuber borchii]
MNRATDSPPRPSPGPRACVSEPGFGFAPAQTTSAILDPPSGDIAPTITADKAGPGSSDDSCGDKNIHAEGANAMQSGENDMTSLTATGADNTEVTTSGKKRTRQRKFWFRNLSPVRTRSSTGSLPRISKNSHIKTTPQKVEGMTLTKPRKPRGTPSTTSAVKKPNPTRKRKSAPVGRARKRSKKSLAQGDKRVGGGVGDGGQAAEIDGKDNGSDYEDKVKTPGISDDGASSPGRFYDEPDADTYAKPDESVPRDGVKTPGISDDEASSPGRYYDERDTDAYARSDDPAPRDGVRTPGVSDAASSPGGFYGEQDTNVYAKPDESALGNGVNTPGVSDDEASSPGGYYEQDARAHAKPIECGHRDRVRTPDISDTRKESLSSGQSERSADNGSGAPVGMGSQGSIEAPYEEPTNLRADENGAGGFKEAEVALSDNELKLGKTNPTEYQVEDGLSVQNRHDSAEPEAKPGPSPLRRHGSDKRIDLEAQELAHPDQAPEVANSNATSDIKFAVIIPTNCLSPEDFITNIKSFKFQNISEPRSKVTHLFIYFTSPASRIQFVASVSPVDIAPSPPIIGENEGTGPGSPDQSCTDYEVNSLWQLAEEIPLVKLQEAYGYEGPPTEPIEVSPEILAAHPLTSMRKVF